MVFDGAGRDKRARPMIRKDYILIARAVASMDLNAKDKRHVADCLARELKADNVAFKPHTFHIACGTETSATSEALADVRAWQKRRK